MSGLPYDSRDYVTPPDEFLPVSPPRTSRLAIASLVCGLVGLVTCCTFVPGLVGLGLGIGAWPGISRGAARGRGLAIAGIVISIVSLLMGIGVWVALARSPELRPIPGDELDRSSIRLLQDLGALEDGETITFLYSGGLLSIRENGVILTDRRIVTYVAESVEFLALEDVTEINFTPSQGFWQDGEFVVYSEDDFIVFYVGAEERGDLTFERALRQAVNGARAEAGLEPLPDEE